MRLYETDEMLIKINNIRNIELIKIYDIFATHLHKLLVIPALFIEYDGGKQLNLSSKEKYFIEFVKKVTEVYNDEKNNILESSLTDPFKLNSTIKIDAHTKSILENGELTKIDNLYEFYKNKKSYDNSLIFSIDEVKTIIPIIKYHLKELFSKTDQNINFTDTLYGYKNTFMLEGEKNGLYATFPFIFYKQDDNEYIIEIGGLFQINTNATIKIKFLKDKIEITIDADKYEITSTFTYLITTSVIKEIISIHHSGKTVHYKNNDLPQTENTLKGITDFDNTTNLTWYKLPWNAFYGINNSIEPISETEKIVQINNMYVYCEQDSFIKKEFYSRSYKRNNTVSMFTQDITLEDAIKNTTCICINKENNLYLIETAFLNTPRSSGHYKDSLKERYFYHILTTNNIENLTRENLINFGMDDGIIQKTDILNKNLTLKLIRGV